MSTTVKTMPKNTVSMSAFRTKVATHPSTRKTTRGDNVAVQWEEANSQWYCDEECTTPWGGEHDWQDDGDEWRD